MVMWKTRMIQNKNQIKWLFNLKRNIKLTDEECINRIQYIMYKMTNDGYETKDWLEDLLQYKEKELHNMPFDEADYVAYCSK